jgi:hypothetical protein
MSGHINRSLFVFAAASALAACASNPPVSSNEQTAAKASTPTTAAAATTAANPKSTRALSGYRSVTKNGQEYFCRREPVLGSRTETIETCLTKAQMETAKNDSQDLMRRIQAVPGTGPSQDPGGVSSGVMTR